MEANELFRALDTDKDGRLSRRDLNEAALKLNFHWREAPFLAVFDLLTINEPLPEKTFMAYWDRIMADPMGPYGDILLKLSNDYRSPGSKRKFNNYKQDKTGVTEDMPLFERGPNLLNNRDREDSCIPKGFERVLNSLDMVEISVDDADLLIIDPQRSFTKGAWMQSIGPKGEEEVRPIKMAFKNCRQVLARQCGMMEIMFSRCPFPPDSYGWDDSIKDIIDERQLYFLKPGNSILFPPANGFREWISRLIEKGKRTLVIGGCTLNSCVRVSAIEVLQYFGKNGLKVVVDLNITGARTGNYRSSSRFGGLSAVESAVNEMISEGVKVVRNVDWRLH